MFSEYLAYVQFLPVSRRLRGYRKGALVRNGTLMLKNTPIAQDSYWHNEHTLFNKINQAWWRKKQSTRKSSWNLRNIKIMAKCILVTFIITCYYLLLFIHLWLIFDNLLLLIILLFVIIHHIYYLILYWLPYNIFASIKASLLQSKIRIPKRQSFGTFLVSNKGVFRT